MSEIEPAVEDLRHATRRFYDTVADAYAAALPDTRAEAPLDLGTIAQFVADLPRGDGVVVDAGCGSGRMLTHLNGLGVSSVIGFDLSPAMVAQARAAHPDVLIEVADLTALPMQDAAARGILCWYAVIHTAAEELPAVFAEARRVLAPGGGILLGFQAGAGERLIQRAYGHDVSFEAILHEPHEVAALVKAAGFDVTTVAERAARGRERHAQGFVLARRR
ncbi:class I SAM-dependent DNA methyltransferase [Microbacterium trichothecenolyticum]|uniref:SAM-dependent methyltransferase n=1 Tax=Microbacterium trichothecenolyticum TaxID=69370 RepID=A0ABU0TSS2_MICTR|nr:class I SAM-dependent methyltransferase [Microbacterium trichothecenolyticum]MDQ1122721.1 SAM-dependent methyltransferase [Microbacterium trichothecenolyticum]